MKSKTKKKYNKSLEKKVIDAGLDALRIGRAFPSESSLVELLSVGRSTLRETLARLEESGLLFRSQGSKTLINEFAIGLAGRFDQFGDFSEVISSAGMKPIFEVLSEKIHPWAGLEHIRFREEPDFVMRSVKRWKADGVPARAVVDIVPLPTDSDYGNMMQAESVLKAVERIFGERVTWEISVPTAVIATTELVEWLMVPPKSPLLLLRGVGVTSSGKECFRTLDYHVPDLVPQAIIRTAKKIASQSN